MPNRAVQVYPRSNDELVPITPFVSGSIAIQQFPMTQPAESLVIRPILQPSTRNDKVSPSCSDPLPKSLSSAFACYVRSPTSSSFFRAVCPGRLLTGLPHVSIATVFYGKLPLLSPAPVPPRCNRIRGPPPSFFLFFDMSGLAYSSARTAVPLPRR